jgi:hypothetical protein
MSIYDTIKQLNIEQFKSSENFNKVLQVATSTFDELDTVFADLKVILNIANSSGKQLDLIGHIIVEGRNGRNDADYRSALTLKIFKNTSRAFVEDIVEILTIVTNATKVVYSDNPPAAYTIYTNGETLPTNIKTTIDRLSAAGVAVLIYASDGQVPFIATEIETTQANLQTDSGDNLVDDAGSQFVVDYESGVESNKLQSIFGGREFGVVENLDLITDTGDTLVTDTGAILGCYDEDQNITDGGLANLAYQ